MKGMLPVAYAEFLKAIKERVRSAQYTALHAVNKEMIAMYWDIGRMIVERQKNSKWGRAVVERLARDLQEEFTGKQGFSAQNLWYMRQFYLEYCNKPNLQPLVGEISWSKHLIIMARCKDDLQREFYIRMIRKFGWSKNVLVHHIENQIYEKTLLGQSNFDKTLPEAMRSQAKLALRDEYTFDSLELGEEHTERDLERALISRIEYFLMEMGGSFSFLGSQYRLQVGDKEYYIDLLLFHRGLQCIVAIELKVSEFQPEYVGKMQFYLAVLDDVVRLPHENASIGIILCKTKDRIIVEYALKNSGKPIGVGEYRIVSKLPKDLRGQLPTAEQIGVLVREDV